MAVFNYKLEKEDGTIVEGQIEAADKNEARLKLAEYGGKIVEVLGELELSWAEVFDKNNRKITSKDLFLFTKYFSVLLKAGIPVVKCMDILHSQMPNLRFKKRIAKMKSDIESGISMYEAFSQFPEVFNNMYCNLIKTGEESGLLFEIFNKLTIFLEKSLALRSKVKSAMVYPTVIALVAGAVVTFLLAFIIPRFEKIFASFGAKLPTPTRIMIMISKAIRSYAVFGVIGVVIALFLFFKWRATPTGRRITDNITLKLPLFGSLSQRYTAVSFCSNLAILLRSGVNISRALEIVSQSIENVIIREEIESASSQIEAGESIAKAFAGVTNFPELAKQMIAVGDETGNLEDMLQNVSEFYEEEVEGLVDTITSLIEPLFIVFLGLVVGSIVISMFFPMFQMARVVQGGNGGG
jgi:type IV pilus assembly protein PilC